MDGQADRWTKAVVSTAINKSRSQCQVTRSIAYLLAMSHNITPSHRALLATYLLLSGGTGTRESAGQRCSRIADTADPLFPATHYNRSRGVFLCGCLFDHDVALDATEHNTNVSQGCPVLMSEDPLSICTIR